jgi:hypothetical protein
MSIYVARFLPYGYISRNLVWCRLWSNGYGLCVKRTPPLFSERNGYRRTYRLGFGWRLEWLKPWKRGH